MKSSQQCHTYRVQGTNRTDSPVLNSSNTDSVFAEQMLSVFDFIAAGRRKLSQQAVDYLESASEDEVTKIANELVFCRLWIKPRVLMSMKSSIDTTTVLAGGSKSAYPIYISATARGRLFHPEGELAICRGAGYANVVQMCPTLASYDMKEMASARVNPSQSQWYQLYVNRDDKITESLVLEAGSLGMKALVITVDVVFLGKRERDQRNNIIVGELANVQKVLDSGAERTRGVSQSLSSFISPGLDWNKIRWIKSLTKLPILLKGIQTFEDALIAYESNTCDGIIISNHGGRQVDFARPTLLCLAEISARFRNAGIIVNRGTSKPFDIYIDGGVKRGSDIFKCLALGAKAVGIGRPSLYALASHGDQGVARLVQIMGDELKSVMAHTGCNSLADINSNKVDCTNLSLPVVHDRHVSGLHSSKL